MASPSALGSRGHAAQNLSGRLSLQRQRQLFLASQPDNGVNHENVPPGVVVWRYVARDAARRRGAVLIDAPGDNSRHSRHKPEHRRR